ncbi:MAG: hypothetical protein KKE24_03970 [Candidatus Thermoplasmatota archaeon]|nr:hypothetical protein [Candidatus Thermoplasmatota archaeon]
MASQNRVLAISSPPQNIASEQRHPESVERTDKSIVLIHDGEGILPMQYHPVENAAEIMAFVPGL